MDVSKLFFALMIEPQNANARSETHLSTIHVCSSCAVVLQVRICAAMLKCRAYNVGPGAQERMPHRVPKQAKRRRFVALLSLFLEL
jgi:hypothetical protein